MADRHSPLGEAFGEPAKGRRQTAAPNNVNGAIYIAPHTHVNLQALLVEACDVQGYEA